MDGNGTYGGYTREDECSDFCTQTCFSFKNGCVTQMPDCEEGTSYYTCETSNCQTVGCNTDDCNSVTCPSRTC